MNKIDKCIKLNFAMVENEIGFLCVLGSAMIFCAVSPTMFFFIPIAAAVLMVFLIKMYKKLFYTSIYGETAPLYQSLPVTVEDMVISRIFTAGTGLLLAYAVTNILCILLALIVDLYDSILDLLIEISEINPDISNIGALLALALIKSALALYRQSAFVFMVIVLYNSFPQRRRTRSIKVLAFVIAGAAHLAVENFDNLMELIGAEQAALWIPAVCIVLDIFLIVVFYRITVKKLKTKYSLN